MAGKENPFSRAIASKKTADAEPVAPVSVADGVQTSLKNDELAQASNDGNAPDDTPDAGSGEETFGLGDTLRPAKEVGASVQDDAAAAAESPPESKAAQFGIDVVSAAAEGALGGGGGGDTQTSGSGGGGIGDTQTSAGSGIAVPAELTGGVKDDLAAASGDHGPSVDLTSPDLIAAVSGAQSGGESLTDLQMALANAAIASASATASGPSVAADGDPDGGALAEAIAAADKEAPKTPVSPLQIGAGEAEEGAEAEEPGIVDQVLDWIDGDFKMDTSSGALPSRDFTGIEGFTPAGTTTQAEAGKAVGVSNLETSLSTALGSKKGGGVKDPGPDSDSSPPPTPEQFALQQAIKAELGQVRIPGDIDPSDGDGTNTGPASAGNLSAADQILFSGKTFLVGNPGALGESPAPLGGGGTVTAGPDGREIQLEDGDNFNVARGEDEPDFNVGQDPLIGLPSQDDDQETESGKQDLVGSLSAFDQPDKDADDD